MFHFNWPWKKTENEWQRWFSQQLESLAHGEEIEPPWVVYPDSEPWWGGWRQGNSEGWLVWVWLPFWQKLSGEEQLQYLEKWHAPAAWREYLQEEFGADEASSIAGHVLNYGIFHGNK